MQIQKVRLLKIMKKSKKFLAAFMAVIIIAACIAAPTYSWLSSRSEQVVNTFAGGAITVTVDEAQVDTDGKKIDGGERVVANSYKYAAGSVLDKDPTPTILKGSVECYVFLCVENQLDDLFSMDINTADWTKVSEENGKAIYIYKETVDAENADEDITLSPIFTQVTVSKELTQDDVSRLGEKNVNVTAYAIQTEALTQEEAVNEACGQFFTN